MLLWIVSKEDYVLLEVELGKTNFLPRERVLRQDRAESNRINTFPH
jgi:hypothetical protein